MPGLDRESPQRPDGRVARRHPRGHPPVDLKLRTGEAGDERTAAVAVEEADMQVERDERSVVGPVRRPVAAPVVTDGVTNSVATAGESGSSRSSLISLANVECQSPVRTTGLLTRRLCRCMTMRARAAG